MGLFDPVWMTEKPKQIPKAIAAVKKMDDPNKLREVALQARISDIRQAACDRIDDQDILAEIAKNGGYFAANRLLGRLTGRNDLLMDVALRYAGHSDFVAEAIDAMPSPRPDELAKLRLAVTKAYCGYDMVSGRSRTYSDLSQADKQDYERAKTQVSEAIERAMAKITDSQEMLEAIKVLCDHGWLVPGFQKMLDVLTPDQLILLAQDSDVNPEVRLAACARAGHELDSRCKCTRCGKANAHQFTNGTCTNCGARRVVETEELKDSNMGSKPITFGTVKRT